MYPVFRILSPIAVSSYNRRWIKQSSPCGHQATPPSDINDSGAGAGTEIQGLNSC